MHITSSGSSDLSARIFYSARVRAVTAPGKIAIVFMIEFFTGKKCPTVLVLPQWSVTG